jgi:transcription elongation factor Elf1
MSNDDSKHVRMQIECPQCRKKMLLHVGLEADTSQNVLECPNCRNTLIPLLPGSIIGGPFSVDA